MEQSTVAGLARQLAHISDTLRAVVLSPDCTLTINVSPVESFVVMCDGDKRKVLAQSLREELGKTFDKLSEQISKQL